ncbi:hypothetical protein Pla52o_40540 [Novipirellula galeiformis]|uniref:Uncharacterized protein n=1 Tax=Novipirellula galeiformis TaxID=2528004 RepID=A0A5C6CA54_9BACT|nr:hypothetical protein [Novipirellula galeiformis]TWU21022.1 hypothetical protein Pla52o_40540 [Novipirellula galeiformis]
MWKSNELGSATWSDANAVWRFNTSGGAQGIQIGLEGENLSRVELTSVADDTFPTATEQFIRGDQLHVQFPQDAGSYSIEAVFKPIRSSENQLLIEVTLSLETLWLDTHPTVDLVARGGGGKVACDNAQANANADSQTGHCAPISLANSQAEAVSVAVLLGQHDAPFSTDCSTDDELRLRLFGEFLEKGVTRKARPWIALSKSTSPFTTSELTAAYAELCASPLPLTP